MTAFTKVSDAWRTVSAAYFKMSGTWRTASAIYVRAPWPIRYASALIPPNYLAAPYLWWLPYAGYPATPAAVVEGGAIRLTWTLAAGQTSMRGIGVTFRPGRTYDISLTTSQAPAGVPWRVAIDTPAKAGNDVTGPGTSTMVYTHPVGGSALTYYVGLHTGEGANGTAGHLVTSLTVTVRGTSAVGANDAIPFVWRQAHPALGVGTPAVVSPRKEKALESYGYFYPDKITFNGEDGHWANNIWELPAVPFYRVRGDLTQIASAKVTLRFTPIAPKSPVEHTISWEAPVGWALYHIGYMGNDGYSKFYYAALTDAEFATERAKPDRVVTRMWSPREGGWFVYMPVCWDASGVTVPMRANVADSANSGDDIYSGYGNFPPNRAASSVLADYTVGEGYSDMRNYSIVYSAITIELKNSGGTVIASWTGSLPAGQTVDSPGKGVAPVMAAAATRSGDPMVQDEEFYWPQEWRGLFDKVDTLYPVYTVRWGRDIPNKGEAEWDVFDTEGTKIGDFRLAMRYGFPGQIEIRGVNLAPDLVGMKIMRHIVEHGVTYCPTPDVIIRPPDATTYSVMQSWGWREMSSLSAMSLVALPLEYRENVNECLFMHSDPMYNRFHDLGFPEWSEVTRE